MRTRYLSVIAATIVLLATGCGGSDVKGAEGDTAAKKVEGDKLSNGDIEKYFDAISSADPTKIEDVLTLAAPSSIAFAYLRYQEDANNAAIDGGSPYPESTMTKVDGGFKNCNDPADKSSCAVWADFESVDGKLAKFTVNGVDLKDRISIGDGSKAKVGSLGTIEFLGAYQSVQTGDVAVNVRVTSNKDAINIASYEATYRGTDKRQITAASIAGPTELGADSTAYVSMFFEHAKPGGELKMTLNSEDFMTSVDARIKTR